MCIEANAHTHSCLAVYDSSVAWQPGHVCLLIHMILFGIDRAVFQPLPLSSLCPPPLLLSSAPSQGWMEARMGCAKPSLCTLLCVPRHKHKLLVSWPVPAFLFSSVFFTLLSTHHLCHQPFPLHNPLFHPSRPASFFLFSLLSLSLSPSFSLILSLPHSIVNFNLRAGLNGTIRERSMLLIWIPVHLDLGVPHQRRRKKSLFSSSGEHISKHILHILNTHTCTHTHTHKSLIKDVNARDRKYLCTFKLRRSHW